MHYTKNIGFGLVAACVGYYWTAQTGKVYWLSGFLTCIIGTAAVLRWLKTIEPRQLRRLLVRASALLIIGVPSMAQAAGGGNGGGTMADIKTHLGQAIGLIMWIAIPTGIVMIIKAIFEARAGGEWKQEIVKGLVMMGAPLIINVLFGFFFGAGNQVTVAFQ